MRLVLVHGINNENHSAADIEDIWMGALYETWNRYGLPPLPGVEITAAYYADQLARLSMVPAGAVTAGAGSQAATTEIALLQEYANAAGITDADVASAALDAGIDLSVVEAGLPHEGWVIGLARALERVLPTRGKYIARVFLKQAARYIARQGIQNSIKRIVRDQIFVGDGPMVIVAHSLGTVISYELLTERGVADRKVPLFCTLGSPLGVRIVADYVGRRTSFPQPPVGKWLNCFHPHDFVALGRSLDEAVMGFQGIENDNSVVNEDDDKHDVRAYLAHRPIAEAVYTALTT